MKKSKYQEERKKYFFKKNLFFPILLSFSCLFLCIGYAHVNDINLNISGLSSAEIQKGLFISNVNINNENQTSSAEILNSHATMLNTNILLANDALSEISFDITIYNNSDVIYVYNKATPNEYDEDFYTNKYIVYQIDERIIQGDKIEGRQDHEFTITFKYIDGLDFANLPEDFSNSLSANINFDFKQLQQVTVGDNIFDPATKVVDTYVNTDGRIIDYSGWSSSDYLDVSNYEYLIILADSDIMLNNWNAAYDENKNFAKMLTINKARVKNSELGDLYLSLNILKVEEGFKYLRISAKTSVLNNVKIYPVLNDDFNMVLDYNITAFQVLFGDSLYNSSNNSLNTYINNTNGALIGYTAWQSSEYIDVSNYEKIIIASDYNSLLSNWNAFYDENKNFVKNLNCSSLTKYYNKNIGYYIMIDIPDGVNYLRISEKNSIMTALKIYENIAFDYEKNEPQNLKIGENAYNYEEIVTNTYIDTGNGAEIAYNGWSSSNYIDIGNYDDWIIVGDSEFLSEWNAFYDENKNFVSSFDCSNMKLYNRVLGNQSASMCVINRKEGIKYIRISELTASLKNIRVFPILNEDFNGVISLKIIK